MHDYSEKLYSNLETKHASAQLVDLVLPRQGFREFISSWIVDYADRCIVVDPGPSASIEILIDALGGKVPDAVLLTHIHVDHAGGAGALAKRFPNTRFYVADSYARHLIDPVQLIKGSEQTLGELMLLYGEILPIRREQVCGISVLEKDIPGVKRYLTPGHAAHHVSYQLDSMFFCGEALGVRCPLSVSKDSHYLRPATPKRFISEIYCNSIRLIREAIEHWTEQSALPAYFCFGHFGALPADLSLCDRSLAQIQRWIQVVDSLTARQPIADREALECRLDDYIGVLKKEDEEFRTFSQLPEDIQARERSFVSNSIWGIIQR